LVWRFVAAGEEDHGVGTACLVGAGVIVLLSVGIVTLTAFPTE
jgi:hypothetical protein